MKVSVKARKVTVTGPRGSITKDFSHSALDIRVMKVALKSIKGLAVRIQMWNGGYKQACSVFTIKSLIKNMMIGVTEVSRRLKLIFFKKDTIMLFWCVFLDLFDSQFY